MATGMKTGGRQKGTPNKLTIELKGAIEGAFAKVGGQRYLEGIAKTQPQVFCRMLERLLPKDLNVTLPPEPITEVRSTLEIARRIAFVLAMGAREANQEANTVKKRSE